jgi:rRNA pseudouridine-1189 N-methylase Emg1 (Nep1/Mra1 family)
MNIHIIKYVYHNVSMYISSGMNTYTYIHIHIHIQIRIHKNTYIPECFKRRMHYMHSTLKYLVISSNNPCFVFGGNFLDSLRKT